MATTVSYNGQTIASFANGTKKLLTNGKLMHGDVTVVDSEPGVELDPLSNPATDEKIINGYEAYDDSGEKIIGTYVPVVDRYDEGYEDGYEQGLADASQGGIVLEPLSNPASETEIVSGYEAYDAYGNVIVGTYDQGYDQNTYNQGYNAGYSTGYLEGSALTYVWDPESGVLTITEVQDT